MPPGGPPYRAPKKTPGGGGYDTSSAPPAPPSKKSSATSERAIFTAFINSHAALRPYASDIWKWTMSSSGYGGITATQLAAVIWLESKGDPSANSGKALGIAQIHDNVANATNAAGVPFFGASKGISEQDKLNPAFAIRYAAWRLSGYASVYGGSIDDIWKGGYNPGYGPGEPGYVKNPVSQFLPKDYVGTGGLTIDQSAGQDVTKQNLRNGLTDPWVVGINAKTGKLRVVKSANPPKNAIMYDGVPMSASDWARTRRDLDQYFVSYTGGRPDNKMVLKYVQKGWSPYYLTTQLAKLPSFQKSPIWKSQAPAYQAAAKDLLPEGKSAPAATIKQAIINNWGTATFQAVLRTGDGYIHSNEFKSNATTLLNVHQSIMGVPDQKALTGVKDAALAGWSTDQYAAYLRSTPQYTSSPEYQSKTLTFLSALGLITGENAVLKKGIKPDANPNVALDKDIPTDKRIQGEPGLTRPEDTVATYGG
jgi:hypothetical protein